MNRRIAMILALVLLTAPASADDPTPPASPSAPATPAAPHPDFASVQKHLVVVKNSAESTEQSPGFSISDQGHIVTYGGKLRDGQSYVVVTAGGQMFSATRIKADEPTGLWILQLSGSGHGLTGLPFASTALQAAVPLYAVNFNPSGSERFTSVPGTVTQLMNTEQGQMIRHNALFGLASAGTPLLNRCFQAVGVNLLEEEGLFSRPVDPTQKGSARSLTPVSLSGLLTSLGLSLPVAGSECLSLEAETQQELEQARQDQEAERQRQQEAADQRVREAEAEAQRRLEQQEQEKQAALQRQQEEALRKEDALQREKDAAEERARRIEAEKRRTEEETQRQLEQQEQDQQAALQRQQEEAHRKEAALQREKDEAEQRQRHILLIGSIIGGLVLLGGLLLMRRKQKRLRATEQEKQHIEQEKQHLSGALNQAQSELSQAAEQDRLRSTAPDIFLEGETPRIALKIPGAALVERTGAVVGRSPSASTFVINHEQISRQHFRLSLVSHQVLIEDLGSTNGTSVDGVPLEPGQQMPVRAGGRLGLGDLELTLHLGG